MSNANNVVSMFEFKQKKLEDAVEAEWNVWDYVFANATHTEVDTFTVSFSDENGDLWSEPFEYTPDVNYFKDDNDE